MKTERRKVVRRKQKDDHENCEHKVGTAINIADVLYEAEEILASRMRNGKEEFHVKWRGSSMSACTWETEENIKPSSLIKAYITEEGTSRRKRKTTDNSSDKMAFRRDNRYRKTTPSSKRLETVPKLGEDSAFEIAITAKSTKSPDSTIEISTDATPREQEPSAQSPNFSPKATSPTPTDDTWVDPSSTPLKESALTNAVQIMVSDIRDESAWTVLHLGTAPSEGVSGHWALVSHQNDTQVYVPINVARELFPNRLFDYLLARVRFG